MTALIFNMKPVDRKPSRKRRSNSQYNEILNKFLEGQHDLVELHVEDLRANYVSSQIKNRIKARGISNTIKVSVVNNAAYLEKL